MLHTHTPPSDGTMPSLRGADTRILGREGGREGGREEGREAGREGGRRGGDIETIKALPTIATSRKA